jgi:PAS domain S-box-containing protein
MVGIDPTATGRDTERALRESEWPYWALVAASSDAVYRISADWSEMRNLIGQDFIADSSSPSLSWLEKFIHPDDQASVRQAIDRAIQAKSVFELEHRVIRADGSLGWMHSRAAPLIDNENIMEWIGTAVDVTERKRGEAALRRSEAWLAGQKEALQAAVNGAPLAEALGILIRTAIEQTDGNARCAFYSANREGTKLHHVVGMSERYARYVEGFKIGRDSLSCGLAVATGEPVITPDVFLEPRWKPWLWLAHQYDFRGCWSFPVGTSVGKLVGTFAMYFKEPRTPTPADLEQAATLTDTASIIMSRYQEAEERERGTLELRESEARLSALLRQVPGGVGLFDRDGRLLLRAGPLGRLWDDLVPSQDAQSLRRKGFTDDGRLLSPSEYPDARALRGEIIAPGLDFIHTAGDGSETWIRCSAAPFRNETGEVIGAVAILQDIDEEKRAAQRLRASEAHLRFAVDLAKLGLYVWNLQSNELSWDDRLRAMWGLPAGAPTSFNLWKSCIHPDDIARVEAAIQQSRDPHGNGMYDIEYRVIGKSDGIERWIATLGQTSFENSRPTLFRGVALDVTDRKRIERALEHHVEIRTRELQEANRQLRAQIEQREIAEAASQQLQRLDAIGQITSGVAHDFNNLLSVVLTNARMLSRNLGDPGDQEGIELVIGAAQRGANLTAQLLAFSRQQRLEPKVVDLNNTIVKMGGLLNASLRGAIQLRKNLAADLWPALVDLTQVQAVILNLVINARDAMRSGGTLTLETFNAIIDKELSGPEAPAPGKYVGLAIRDTGMGIPDDVLPHVFEPFFTTKGPGNGSGLGLAQVIGFAKQSGGGIALKTRVGEGTSVTVFLPCGEVVRRVRKRESDAEQFSTVELTPCILVVDDDQAVLRSTIRVLGAVGYAPVPAASGQEALELIASGLKIELVLADFAMPEMTGVELAKAIRATHPNLPVILVTGYVDREILEEFREAKILRKPYDDDELMKAILTALT